MFGAQILRDRMPRPALAVLALASAAVALNTIPAQATEARLTTDRANIRLSPSLTSPIIGRVERGDRVQVVELGEAPEGWTRLQPFGAVRSRFLGPVLPTSTEERLDYIYGRVIARAAAVRSRAAADGKIVGQHTRGQILAFRQTTTGAAEWLERPDGTFVARAELKLLVGSALEGVRDPPAALAFVLRRVRVGSPEGPAGIRTVLERYAALQVTSLGGEVLTPRGALQRNAVRLAHARPRPAGIGPEERWVHVDTSEQVLTAYEGDRLVFVTLVSTGKRGWETPTGHFRIWLKLRHGEMRGHRATYLVEEVPHSLFFGGETALHGATWHDRFGSAVSHGCVNLSPADAAWLFEWAPPVLPHGWHGILPGPAGLPALSVIIERGDGDAERLLLKSTDRGERPGPDTAASSFRADL
jgi:hypothetical protein